MIMDSEHIKIRRRRSWSISKNRSLNWPAENKDHVKPSSGYSLIVLSFEMDTSNSVPSMVSQKKWNFNDW